MNKKEFEALPEVRLWLDRVGMVGNGSRNTRRAYLEQLHHLSREMNLLPSEILELARRDMKDLERRLTNWYTESSRPRPFKFRIMSSLGSFLKHHGLALSIRLKKPPAKRRMVISKENLKKFLQAADPKLRSLILFLRDSGLGPSDALNLKYGDIREEFESGRCPLAINMNRGKTSVPFTTFIGREAIEALKFYLDIRRRKRKELGDDSPLWPSFHGSWNSPALNFQIRKTNSLLGLNIQAYDLRRYFGTMLRADGVNECMVKFWLGHTLGVEASYLLPSLEQQRQVYAQHYHALSFEEKDEPMLESRVKDIVQAYLQTLGRIRIR